MLVRTRRSVYVVGGLSDRWICDRCVKEALQSLAAKRQPPLTEKTCCCFCGSDHNTLDAITKGQSCICADCVREIDFAFENPIVPAG